MNNRRLRALIVRLQDRLSEDDRKRLHFFLGNDVPRRIRDDPSLGGTLSLMESLFDQDKINDDDFSFLIDAFDEIQCLDAVKLLREHMRQIQSNGINESVQSLSVLMPPLLDNLLKDQDDDDKLAIQMPLINKEIFSNNNNIIINSNNNNINLETNTNSSEIPILSPSISKKFIITNLSIKGKYLILLIILISVLVGIVIGGYIWIMKLNRKCKQIPNDQEMNNTIWNSYTRDLLLTVNDTLYRLESSLSNDEISKKLNKTTINYNELFQKLKTAITNLDDDMKFTEGKTCGCAQWCTERGSLYGVCGGGHTCICTSHLVDKNSVGDGCRCDGWCKRHNYKNGGICGDGYTCICSP